jgi:hypothetical protein
MGGIVRHLTASLVLAASLALASSGAAWSWGAIAVDDSYGDEPSGVGYGFATEASSRQEASTGALEVCRSEGNTECKVMLTFKTCGAYAASHTRYGTAVGATLTAAEKRALTECDGADCIIVVSGCE